MTETPGASKRQALKTPRAAAIAGIIFSVLYGTSMVLINSSLPHEPTAFLAWLEADTTTVTLALNLIPFAGIAFLWFIGVIRDLMSDMEDRLFATVFLGSGLLFLALTFIGAALAAGLLSRLRNRIKYPCTERCTDVQPDGVVSCLQHLCHTNVRCFHDIPGQHPAPHRSDAPWLGIPDVHSGACVIAEYRLFLLGDPDLPGMGAGGKCYCPGPKPSQTA